MSSEPAFSEDMKKIDHWVAELKPKEEKREE
jgi:hypothetical protein